MQDRAWEKREILEEERESSDHSDGNTDLANLFLRFFAEIFLL